MPHLSFWQWIIVALVWLVCIAFLLITRQGTKTGKIAAQLQIGLALVQRNEYAQAELHLEQALNMLNGEAKPDIPQVVSCLAALGQCYQRSGELKKMRQCFEQVVGKWEKMLISSDSAFVDIDYAALNSDFGSGTHDVCEFYLQKVIPLREKMLPQGHADLIGSYMVAAHLLRKLGRKSEADELEKTRVQNRQSQEFTE